MPRKQFGSTFVIGGSPANRALQAIAKAVGFVADRGPGTGEGSISALLKGMIAGEVIVIPKGTTAGLTKLAGELGYLGVSGGPHVLGLLQDIATERLELRLGLAATWIKSQTDEGKQPTEQEIQAMQRVQAMLPRVISWLIDEQMALAVDKAPVVDDRPLTVQRAREKIAELEQGL